VGILGSHGTHKGRAGRPSRAITFAGTEVQGLMGVNYAPPLASIFIRFIAVLLDGLIAFVILSPGYAILAYASMSNPNNPSTTALIFGGLTTVILVFVVLALFCAMWAKGMTPGKYFLGLRVIKEDTGQYSGFWRMALREIIGKWISGVICYLGYIWAFIDSRKQAWHDKIAGTLVISIK